jgi:cyclopropane-fatty-acyl-phospholipid synthase
VPDDRHNFGSGYDRTPIAWPTNLAAAWDELKEQFNERFHRMHE